MPTIILTLMLVGVVFVSGGVDAHARSARVGQRGWASWYGKFHHGRPTASGERFSMYAMTAAHRTLPLGTTVVVTNLQTRRQVVVRINDRGPYVEPERRILDLSRAAARRIGLEQPGLAPVRVVIKRSPRRLTASHPRLVGREQACRPPARAGVVARTAARGPPTNASRGSGS